MRLSKLIVAAAAAFLSFTAAAFGQADIRGDWTATVSAPQTPTQTFTITSQTGGNIVGVGTAGGSTADITGTISSTNSLILNWVYRNVTYTISFYGTVDAAATQMRGTWTDPSNNGTWTAARTVVPPPPPPPAPPVLKISPSSVTFKGARGGSFRPLNRMLRLSSSGGTVKWRLQGSRPPDWLRVLPVNGNLGADPVTIRLKLTPRAKNARRSDYWILRIVNDKTTQKLQVRVYLKVRPKKDPLSDLEIKAPE